MIDVIIYYKGIEKDFWRVKTLEEAMKFIEDYAREYNVKLRLVGLMFEVMDEDD